MKYPQLITFATALPELDQFDAIIDVRTPDEFDQDHLPGAVNFPVLSNEERIRVGTLYKQVSAFEAKKIGAILVARNIAAHVEQAFMQQPREWRPLVYCWRGGNRSGALAHVLAKIGWQAAQLDGGYREYRRHVNQVLVEMAPAFDFRVVCGPTGSGKSRLLQTLAMQGAQVLDLEQLAEHRGSVLGQLPDAPQPAQKTFESRIWHTLRQFDPALPVFVESESKKVGNLRVPEALMQAIRASDCVALELSQANRIGLLTEEYAHFIHDPDLLNARLDYLIALHGHDTIHRWQTMATQGAFAALVEELLLRHYDPAYLRSTERNFARFTQAKVLTLTGIGEDDFLEAAQALL